DNNEMLDQKIENSLENWDLERINVIDRLIMQMSISEMLFMKQYEIPYRVTISSAIENAKKFSSEDSTAFVNGVLDSIYKTL
ncbi:MAG: transcription antitermination factor NusB, partial [Candidatus Neomarinimicrobiota bacterium]|nr:transcription antitermination factor NusB [Candidatus Neomarinimicrobiota bacterium]